MAIKVEMFSNTNQCLIDCETIYQITAEQEPFTFDENYYWFEFGDSWNSSLRHSKDVKALQNFEVLYEIVEQISEPIWDCSENSVEEAFDPVTNETSKHYCKINYTLSNVSKWNNLVEIQPLTLKPTESIKIKVKGKNILTTKLITFSFFTIQMFGSAQDLQSTLNGFGGTQAG